MTSACSIRVRGVVQGVGFRPFVFRLARANTLAGWVLNGDDGVEIHLEGDRERAATPSCASSATQAPAAARITAIDVDAAAPSGLDDFAIRASRRPRPAHGRASRPTCRSATHCLARAVRPRRSALPAIRTSTAPTAGRATRSSCGLPYDRAAHDDGGLAAGRGVRGASITTRATAASTRSRSPARVRPALSTCGPATDAVVGGDAAHPPRPPRCCATGAIVAIKGLGGYHLACDARNADGRRARCASGSSARRSRSRSWRAISTPRARWSSSRRRAKRCSTSPARPIVLAPARVDARRTSRPTTTSSA